jgi:hypothetical protein
MPIKNFRRAVSRTAAGTALLLGATACGDKFVTVTNPNLIDASTVDPVASGATLALSSMQNLTTAMGWMASYGSWFTEETNVGDTFPTRNEFGFRQITDLNTSLNGDVWVPISLAAASSKQVLDLALPTPATNINVARAAFVRGFAVLQIAQDFCEGTLSSGPKLTTTALLDTAAFWFTKAIDVGTANATAEGVSLANASRVGRARAKLQKKDNAGAAADAASVPAGFQYDLRYTDDAANRGRLSNRQWQFSFDRANLSVAPFFRTNDPRVTYRTGAAATAAAQDGNLPGGYYQQTKFPAYGTSMRLASKLEADYIAAEATGSAAMLALIQSRRAALGQPAYAGATTDAAVLTEFYNQRAFEFYLEGKRMGDLRRNPAGISNMTATGGTYFKPGYQAVGSQTCYPLPRTETDNNPNTKP